MTRDALLADVLARPNDDAPRLAFADWCDANGHPHRAAFVHAQLALALLPPGGKPADPWRSGFFQAPNCWTEPPFDAGFYTDTIERVRLRQQAHAIHKEYGEQWRAELPDDWPDDEPEYARGFVETLKIPVRQLAANPARYLDATPVRALTLTWAPGPLNTAAHAPALAALPQLARVERLAFSVAGREFVSAFVRAFVVMPEAAGLRTLDLARTEIEPDSLRAVLYSDHLRELRALDLSGLALEPEVLEELGATDQLPGLRALQLGSTNLSPEGAERLFRGPLLGRLTGLRIDGNATFGAAGTAALAACAHLARFRFVTLDRNAIGDAGCRALAASSHAGALEALSLQNCGITGDGFAALLASDALPQLNTLRLDRNAIGAEALATAPSVPLRRLALDRCPLGDAGFRALASGELLRSLTHLSLKECGASEDGTLALTSSPHLTNLRELMLSGNALTDRAAEVLTANPAAHNLERLGARDTALTDRGAVQLADLPGLRPHSLWLGGGTVTARGEERARKRLEARKQPE